MSQYLDSAGLQTLVTKTKEYARNSAKVAVNPDSAAKSKTITGWNAGTSAAVYGNIEIAESQVTGLTADLDLKAPLDSPAFSGVPTAPKADGTNESAVANVEYVKDLVGTLSEAMLYKGAVSQASDLPTVDYKAGWTYKVAVADTYAGKVCEVGDMIIANKNYGTGASNADWDVIQTNIDGAVTGPTAATSGHFAIFNGTTGKVIMDAGYGLDHFKTVQTTAAFNGDDLQTIQTITQNANGEINVTFQDIQTASTSQAGVVQLSNASASTAEDVAATPKAVKDAYDVLNSLKQDNLVFDGTYDATNNKVATESTVTRAIEALDAPVSAIAPSATITSISETDGKIAITSGAIAITTSQITDFQAVLDGKADKKVPATAGNIATLDASGNLADAGYGIDHFKPVQTAVTDPTASGNGVEFIATIEQDTNGVITATKKTVQNADGSNNGLMSSTDYTKLQNMSVSSVNVTNAGVLEINGNSAMGPISTDAIIDLFS